MTEDQAHANAEALSIAIGITFYVVRNSEGNFSAVQTPADEPEIVAMIEPPSEPQHMKTAIIGDHPRSNWSRARSE